MLPQATIVVCLLQLADCRRDYQLIKCVHLTCHHHHQKRTAKRINQLSANAEQQQINKGSLAETCCLASCSIRLVSAVTVSAWDNATASCARSRCRRVRKLRIGCRVQFLAFCRLAEGAPKHAGSSASLGPTVHSASLDDLPLPAPVLRNRHSNSSVGSTRSAPHDRRDRSELDEPDECSSPADFADNERRNTMWNRRSNSHSISRTQSRGFSPTRLDVELADDADSELISRSALLPRRLRICQALHRSVRLHRSLHWHTRKI